jgi:hypothetical protein
VTAAATAIGALPRVTAVNEVIGHPRPLRDARTYYSAAAYDALRGDHGKPSVTVLDGTCYAETIKRALSSPPGAADEGGDVSSACPR